MVGTWVFTLCEVPWAQMKRSVSGNVIRYGEIGSLQLILIP